jgi:Tetracyclin repressor-like, C-terminal domain
VSIPGSCQVTAAGRLAAQLATTGLPGTLTVRAAYACGKPRQARPTPTAPRSPTRSRPGGAVLPASLAGIALNAWASVLGYLTLEIFGSLTRLITDTDELYRAHVHTVMLSMASTRTSPAPPEHTARPRSLNVHGA